MTDVQKQANEWVDKNVHLRRRHEMGEAAYIAGHASRDAELTGLRAANKTMRKGLRDVVSDEENGWEQGFKETATKALTEADQNEL